MRIGEIKNIIGKVLNTQNVIQINNDPLYAGQAYRVDNFVEIMEAVDVLISQSWNVADHSQIDLLKSEHADLKNPTVLNVTQFNQLNSYISNINSQVPLFYSVLTSLTEDQDEKTINVLLPRKINSLSELSALNERLNDILKLFNVDGQFELKGFDVGSQWYIMLATGPMTYAFIIACLKIAQEYFKARTEYFKSEEARISYETTLKDPEKDDKGYEKYQIKWLQLFIEKEVSKIIDTIGQNGHTKPELQVKLVKATTKLVEELDEGTEFHLSLNPPDYAREESGRLEIDYRKIKAANPLLEEATKTIEAPKEKIQKKNEGEN